MKYLLVILLFTACSNTTKQPVVSNPNTIDCVEVASLFEDRLYMFKSCLDNK